MATRGPRARSPGDPYATMAANVMVPVIIQTATGARRRHRRGTVAAVPSTRRDHDDDALESGLTNSDATTTNTSAATRAASTISARRGVEASRPGLTSG